MNHLIYLYGFVPSEGARPGSDLVGIGGAQVALHELDGFCAVISQVDAEQYSASAIEARMQNLEWVAERGVEHERVVAWFVDREGILPASLFTLYSSVAALVASANERGGRIRGELERLRGLREWDLKVSYQAARLAEHAARHSATLSHYDQEVAAATPGRRYLMEKKRSEVVKQEVSRVARQLAAEVVEAARSHVRSMLSLPLPASGQELPVVLQAALLVEAGQELQLVRELSEAAERLEAEGVSVSFSGPWAPYRFIEHDAAAG